MRPSGEEEYHRVLGFRASLWPRAMDRSEEVPASGGSWLRAVRHPIRWVRWRIELHERGPYAPTFSDFLARPRQR